MKKINIKILAPILPIVVLASAFLYALIADPFSTDGKFCNFIGITGWCCPSCGLTRAVWCILFGRWKDAFYYHALFTVGFIPFFTCLTGMGINFYLGKRVLPLPKYRWIYFYITLSSLIFFTIIRNLTTAIF